jgi:hypothetical protein
MHAVVMLELAVGGLIPNFYSGTLTVIQIRRNSTRHNGVVEIDNTWTFGQTLSVVILFANLKEVISFLFSFRQPERSHERQAEEQRAPNHWQTNMPLPYVSHAIGPQALPAAHASSKAYCTIQLWGTQLHMAAVGWVRNRNWSLPWNMNFGTLQP